MAFFENFAKKVGETAQAVGQKSGELVEITKINLNIGAEEEKTNKVYEKIGKQVYQNHCEGKKVAPELSEMCEEIKGYQDTIECLKQKLLEVKNIKKCPGCDTDLEKEIAFCPKCGAKQEEEIKEDA